MDDCVELVTSVSSQCVLYLVGICFLLGLVSSFVQVFFSWVEESELGQVLLSIGFLQEILLW